jgi:hypothetical protein
VEHTSHGDGFSNGSDETDEKVNPVSTDSHITIALPSRKNKNWQFSKKPSGNDNNDAQELQLQRYGAFLSPETNTLSSDDRW